MLHDLVGDFSWADAGDKAIRTVAVYLGLLVLLRLAGKRQLAQLNTFDFVVLLLLSNVVQNAVIGNDNTLVGGLVGAGILVLGNFLLVYLAFLNPGFERDLRGRASTLVRGGEVQSRVLRRELVSKPELDHALRRAGYDGLSAVEEVVLEPEGTLTVRARTHATIDDVLAALQRIEQRLDGAPGPR